MKISPLCGASYCGDVKFEVRSAQFYPRGGGYDIVAAYPSSGEHVLMMNIKTKREANDIVRVLETVYMIGRNESIRHAYGTLVGYSK